MAITSGFFNSVDGDRKYNADDMSMYFEGLVSDGVYESVGGALQVKAISGMEIGVQSGRAIVNSKWMKSNATYNLTLTAAHVTFNRYTAIVVRLDMLNRTFTIEMKDGESATTPTKPVITNNNSVKELCLAYIYVAAGATAITQANISDMRGSSSCPWVTGVVKQVDTSELFLQWQKAYEEYFADMEAWKAQQEAAFDTWFTTLTSQLNVNTYVKNYHKVVEMGSSNGVFPLDMTGYTYAASDILFVNVNGVMLTETYDYLLDTTKTPVEIHTNAALETSNILEITVLKSKIGQA